LPDAFGSSPSPSTSTSRPAQPAHEINTSLVTIGGGGTAQIGAEPLAVSHDAGWHLVLVEVEADIGSALATRAADKVRLKIGEPEIIGPSITLIATHWLH
jgi:hypothetical protein